MSPCLICFWDRVLLIFFFLTQALLKPQSPYLCFLLRRDSRHASPLWAQNIFFSVSWFSLMFFFFQVRFPFSSHISSISSFMSLIDSILNVWKCCLITLRLLQDLFLFTAVLLDYKLQLFFSFKVCFVVTISWTWECFIVLTIVCIILFLWKAVFVFW
jgi:hypothetical protein